MVDNGSVDILDWLLPSSLVSTGGPWREVWCWLICVSDHELGWHCQILPDPSILQRGSCVQFMCCFLSPYRHGFLKCNRKLSNSKIVTIFFWGLTWLWLFREFYFYFYLIINCLQDVCLLTMRRWKLENRKGFSMVKGIYWTIIVFHNIRYANRIYFLNKELNTYWGW